MRRHLTHIAFLIALLVASMVSSAKADPVLKGVGDATQGTPTWHRGAVVTTQATPTQLTNEPTNEWTIGSGLLYWALRCSGTPEFQWNGYLRRMPSLGGTTRTLTTVPSDKCYTFLDMAADDSGVYYFSNSDRGRIERRSTSSPYDPSTTVYTLTELPGEVPVASLVLDASHIYWPSYDGRIFRVAKDGSERLVIATTGANPRDLVVDDSNIYWLDDDGLWVEDKRCTAPPCATKQRLVNTHGSHLLRYGSYIYWVEVGDRQSIRRATLSGDPVTTLYTAPADHPWRLGQLGTDGISLFWKESYYELGAGGTSDGRLRRLPINGGTAVDIAVNLDYGDDRLFTDDLGVYFLDGGWKPYIGWVGGISRLPFNASALLRDLKADAWEVTQGIQNLANDVPLVANKPTYVRFYGRELSGPNATAVEAYLYGWRNGVPLPSSPLRPVNATRALAAGIGYNRADPKAGWLFQLHESWMSPGTITLQAVVDPRGTYADPNRSNNTRSGTVTFTHKAPVCPIFIPIHTHAPYASTNDPNFWRMIDLFKRLWPVSDVWAYYQTDPEEELEDCWFGPFPYPCHGPYEIPEDNWKIIASLFVRDLFTDDPDACDAANARAHYVGMVHPDTNTGPVSGYASLVSSDAWVKFPPHDPNPPADWTWPDAGGTMAQELAHNYDRHHVNCPSGAPEDIDNRYPYPPCQLDNTGPTAHYGFDINTQTPIAPDAAADYMSYGSSVWVSDYSWRAMFNEINNRATSQAERAGGPASEAATVIRTGTPAANPPDLATAESVVLATGVITPSLNQGYLNYAWVFPTVTLGQGLLKKWQAQAAPRVAASQLYSISSSAPAQHAYHLRLLAANGDVLDDRTVVLMDNLQPDDQSPRTATFALSFPAPAGVVARLDLMDGATVLASSQPGMNVPTVTIITPSGGETFDDRLTVTWHALDTDRGDRLLYTIQYSPDMGRTWRALATNFPGPSNSDTVTLSLPILGGLPGSSGGALVRVAATDGYHTSLAISQPFRVPNRSPEPYIVSPTMSWPVAAGQPAISRGGATDAEDGGLSGTALRWTVDGRDNGSGQEQRVEGLAPGTYDVALTARDTAGQERTVHAPLSVSTLRIPLGSAPALDGFCDDATYAGGTTLQLAPYGNGTQATVHLIRDDASLWACFSGMNRGSGGPGTFAGVRLDVNNSRDALAQPDDYGFFVGEDGTPFTLSGDGQGGFSGAGPGALLARTSAGEGFWSAELRIDATVLGDWNHPVGLDLGHYWVRGQGDDYHWPYQSGWNHPNTWARTLLTDSRIFLPLIRR